MRHKDSADMASCAARGRRTARLDARVAGPILAALIWAAVLHPPAGAHAAEVAAPERTKAQAQNIMEAHGFYSVHDLQVDDAGTWRGFATKYDRRWQLEVDTRGNFNNTPAAPRRAPRDTEARPKPRLKLFLVLPRS